MHRLAGIQNLFQGGARPGQGIALRIGQMPVQNTAGILRNGVLGQTENLFRLQVGKGDFSQLVGHHDAHGAGFHDAADEIAFPAKVFLGVLALDGIPDGAVQFVGVKLALDQVVGGAGLHGIDVNLVVALSGQQNHRQPVIQGFGFAQEFKPRPAAEAIVQQADVVFVAVNGGQGGIIIVHPLQLIAAIPDFGNQIARDDVIIFIVIHQQDSDGGHPA